MEDYLGEDFKKEFIKRWGVYNFEIVEELINYALEAQKSTNKEIDNWRMLLNVEKINQLQFNYYISLLRKNNNDNKVNLLFENGINNGTQLNDYTFGDDDWCKAPVSKIVNVLKDIELDWHFIEYKAQYVVRKAKIEAVFNIHKASILEIYNKENYDNYVTGGGTEKTKEYYKNELDRFHKMGLYWNLVYEDIEVDVQYI